MPNQPTDNVYPNRINWINEPITTTPISAGNLNKMDYALHELASRLVNLNILINTDMASQTDLLSTIKNVSYDSNSGIITFTFWNNTNYTIDLNIEKIPVSFTLSTEGILTMTTTDGTEFTTDIKSVIPVYTFLESDTIKSTIKATDNGWSVKQEIIDGSINWGHLSFELSKNFAYAESASELACMYAEEADKHKNFAKSYCEGGTGLRADESINNSKYYYEQTKKYRDEAYEIGGESYRQLYDFYTNFETLDSTETQNLFKFNED